MKTQNRHRGIALLFLNLSARWGGWLMPSAGHFNPVNDLVPIIQEAGWATGPVWTDAEKLSTAGI